MAEPLPRSSTPGALNKDLTEPGLDAAADALPQYLPYRPSGAQYTPPASPQPSTLFNGTNIAGFESLRSKRPANLRTDIIPTPAYERPTYSPSPSSSPTLPSSVPSPHLGPRSRAPSLLRHPAVSSPLNEGFPRAEQPLCSPTFVPLMRQASGPGPTSDPRTIFNPLASNPVNQSGPFWKDSGEDVPPLPLTRPRGLTSSSQSPFNPPLRAASSIPDYSQYRNPGRPNPSGAYRPDRGGANWSHNDHFPVRSFRFDEPRASFRSAWTNASSSLVDVSGTERSSIVTGRSSISEHDNRTASIYSTAASGDGDAYADAAEVRSIDDDEFMSVEDVIDSYCYDDNDGDQEEPKPGPVQGDSRSYSVTSMSDSDAPGLSQTNSQSDGASSHLAAEHDLALQTPQPIGVQRLPHYVTLEKDQAGVVRSTLQTNVSPKQRSPQTPGDISLASIQFSPLNAQLSPTSRQSAEKIDYFSDVRHHKPTVSGSQRQLFGGIYQDLQVLPVLPKDKSRLSRQDWAEIQAYARKNSRGSMQLLDASSPRPTLPLASPPVKESTPLPEVDADDAYPRRASTSVFDRRSTLLELTKALSASPPPQSRAQDQAPNRRSATGKRQSGQTIANVPTSPVLPSQMPENSFANTAASPASPKTRRIKRELPSSASPVSRDRYGFKKVTDKISAQQYDAWYNTYEVHVARRRGKWIALMEKQNLSTKDPVAFPQHCDKVRRYSRKGFPPEWRGAMWWFYSNGQKKLDQMPGVYASLVKRVQQGELNKDDTEAIERDLDRTFPDNIHFRPDTTPGHPEDALDEPMIVQNLREVLQCFALHNPGIGYCQSLNFIAGLLLLFMKQDVEKVFVLLTIITQYHLPGAHARSLANTEVNVLMMLIKDYLPKVWASINDTDIINNGLGSHAHPESKFARQPTVALSCTSWFMSLFVGVLPIEVVLRVWDSFLYEGPRALFRYALAIFKLGEPEIRKFHPGDGELFMTVQNLPRKCLDPNLLHDIAFMKRGFHTLTQDVIDQKRFFWQQQAARDKRSKDLSSIPSHTPSKNGRDGGRDPFLAVLRTAGMADDERKRRQGLRRRASASRRFFRMEKRAAHREPID